jgi:hypothetical protein
MLTIEDIYDRLYDIADTGNAEDLDMLVLELRKQLPNRRLRTQEAIEVAIRVLKSSDDPEASSAIDTLTRINIQRGCEVLTADREPWLHRLIDIIVFG